MLFIVIANKRHFPALHQKNYIQNVCCGFFSYSLPVFAVLKCFKLKFPSFEPFGSLCCCFFCDTAFHYSHSSFSSPLLPFPFKAMRSRSIGECALPSAYIRSAKSAPVLIHTSKPFLPDIVLTPLSDELSGSATLLISAPLSLFNPLLSQLLNQINSSKLISFGRRVGNWKIIEKSTF